MTISEKLAYNLPNEIRFYKEGVFWVAYEYSAYYVWLQKSYKPTRKHMKCLGSDVVCLGFPENALKSFEEKGFMRLPDNRGICVLQLDSPIDEQAFAQWRYEVPFQDDPAGKCKEKEAAISPAPVIPDILEMLKQFPLERRTPVECMQFLSEVKSVAGL